MSWGSYFTVDYIGLFGVSVSGALHCAVKCRYEKNRDDQLLSPRSRFVGTTTVDKAFVRTKGREWAERAR